MSSNSDRRQTLDRRGKVDRRQTVDTKRVYLEIGRANIRLLAVVERDRDLPTLAIARTIPWRDGSIPLSGQVNLAALGPALKQVVQEERLSGAGATVLLSGDLCVTRVCSGLKGAVDREISQLRERCQLYLALGPGPKTISISRTNLDARHDHALVCVVSASVLEGLYEAVESSGMQLLRGESSLVALSRVVAVPDSDEPQPALLLVADRGSLELGLTYAGRLLLEYRPSKSATLNDVEDLLGQHRSRLTRLCQRQLGASVSLDRLLLAGDPDSVSAIQKGFASSDWRIEACEPILPQTWELRGDAITLEFASVVGAATATDSTLRPNLLEQRIAAARPPLRPILIRSAAPLAAVLLLWVGAAIYLWRAGAFNAEMESQLANLRPVIQRSELLKTGLFATEAKLDQLKRLAEAAPPTVLTLPVNRIAGCLPSDVWIDHLRIAEGGATLSGASYTDLSAYAFVKHLQEAPNLSKVALQGSRLTQTPEGPATSFDVQFAVAPMAPVEDKEPQS